MKTKQLPEIAHTSKVFCVHASAVVAAHTAHCNNCIDSVLDSYNGIVVLSVLNTIVAAGSCGAVAREGPSKATPGSNHGDVALLPIALHPR